MYSIVKIIQGRCRPWNISIAALICLTVYNVMLTVKLMYTQECPKQQRITIQKIPQVVYQKCNKNTQYNQDDPFSTLDLELGRWDDQHKYKLFDNIVVGDKYVVLNELFKTCLATQGSLDKLPSLIEVANNWNGPISLATFAASEEELNALLFYILYLKKCNEKINDKVSFHLALTKERRPKKYTIDEDRLREVKCDSPVEVLQHLTKNLKKGSNQWRAKLPYPQNHLRNLARKNCQAGFVFLTDVDIIPSSNMAESLDVFLGEAECKEGEKKCAYVVPTYEIDERVAFPHNKTDLVRMANKGLARPFHHKVFIYNQYATNFTRWQSTKDETNDVHISHPVTNFEFLYEPFYIAPDIVPPHDERFIGYGYTRNSQVYEMYVAGYEFLVLSPIFTCHWGLQVKRSRPTWREHQNNLNRKHFEAFKKEVFARYNRDPLNFMNTRKN
ncbi:beta-1,4-glucuronyltransferase 1 isoform X1 [Diorhabda sublineata]|uniref:beta-1,4-glucuronyltransferase 1 isoform X1 n=1 Tax=Diorhabda sublineata TaxID=1163346 RepID=UPI0024E17F63|nr:beta-1,4-glucuronyltransferase 1 isoform X1 [Diorhabda sublineata]